MSESLIRLTQKGKFWHYSFTTPNGEHLTLSSKTTDKQLASELAAKHYHDIWRQQKLGEKPEYTWKEAVTAWLNEEPHRKNNPNYTIHLRWLDPILSDMKLKDINHQVIQKIRMKKQAEGVQPRTVNAVLQQTRVILRAAYDWEWIDRFPKIKLQKEPERRIRWLTHDEEQRLMPELPEHMKLIVRFALATGLRMSNILCLEWQQIDLEKKQGWIYSDQAKARQSIGIPFNQEAIDILKSCLGKHETHVFTYQNKPLKRINQKAWREALKRAGIENFRFHDLRHTWATRHMLAGTPLHILQELGGWNDITMIRKYAHLNIEHLHKYAKNSQRQESK